MSHLLLLWLIVGLSNCIQRQFGLTMLCSEIQKKKNHTVVCEHLSLEAKLKLIYLTCLFTAWAKASIVIFFLYSGARRVDKPTCQLPGESGAGYLAQGRFRVM